MLDGEAEQAVQESIDRLHGQLTVVVIAHRLATIKNVDEIYVLEEGRIVEAVIRRVDGGPYDALQ
ncbi:MAG: hypothetical protein R3B96_14695 [Pirellulaceae bacterium]